MQPCECNYFSGDVTIDGKLGIGTTPTVNSPKVTVVGVDGTNTILDVFQTGNSDGSYLRFRRARGTTAARQPVEANNPLGYVAAMGWDGGDWGYGAYITLNAAQNWSTNSRPGDIRFHTRSSSDGVPQVRMTVAPTGNVGIGTMDPPTRLSIVGVQDLSTVVDVFQNGNNDGSYLRLRRSQGTYASPQAVLNGDELGYFAVMGNDGTGGATNGYGYAAIIQVKASGAWTGEAHGAELQFQTSSNSNGAAPVPRMTIAADGNVGIGTTIPPTRLSIVGVQDLNTVVDVFQNGNNDGSYLRLRRSQGTYASPQAVLNGDELGYVGVMGHDGTGWGYGALIQVKASGAWTSNAHGADLQFRTSSNSNGAAPVPRMTIAADGNVGIGTTTPGAMLDVAGGFKVSGQTIFNGVSYIWPASGAGIGHVLTLGSGGQLSWSSAGASFWTEYDSGANAKLFPLNELGQVGVGFKYPNLPGAKLHVVNSNGAALFSLGATTSRQPRLNVDILNAGDGPDWPSVRFQADGAAMPHLAFAPGPGNVGVGTHEPATKLEVATQDGAQLLRLSAKSTRKPRLNVDIGSATDGTPTFLFQTDVDSPTTPKPHLVLAPAAGRVGIGTANPEDKLHVVGGGARIHGSVVAVGASISTEGGQDIVTSGQFRAGSQLIADSNGCYYA